jgi:hypothetical protein
VVNYSRHLESKASGTPDGFVKAILMQNMVNGWVVMIEQEVTDID